MRAILPLALSMLITVWTAATWADDKSDCRDGKDADLKIRSCTALIGHDAKDAVAYHNRGVAYQFKGDLDRAIADYDKAIELKPDYAAAYENRARVFVSKGDYTRAVADATKASELTPKLAMRPKVVPSALSQPYGSYERTCRNMQKRGPILFARCLTRDGQWTSTSLDLRACEQRFVENRNGRLVCPGGRGSRSY